MIGTYLMQREIFSIYMLLSEIFILYTLFIRTKYYFIRYNMTDLNDKHDKIEQDKIQHVTVLIKQIAV